jgi:hypothetical protein
VSLTSIFIDAIVATLRISCLTASWTAFGFIGEAFGFEELLFTGTEAESIPTAGTFD